jgi:hypothetical protein
MPILIQHFVEHRQRDPHISLLAFLNEHYVHQYIRDADYQRDNQLPFRHSDCCAVTTALNCECPASTVIVLPARILETKNEYILHDEESCSLLSVADIFQPPRCA